MIKAILIDDEENCLKMLEWEIGNACSNVEVVALCDSGKEGLRAIKTYQPDVIFLDIDMPYMNGFEMLELVPSLDFDIIFTTAYDQYAVKAFKTSAIDYLLKPIDAEELAKAVEKIRTKSAKDKDSNKVGFLMNQLEDIRKNDLKNIALPTFEGFVFIALEKIIYCQSDNSYTHVILEDEKNLFISKSLKEMEQILDNGSFFRVHNSFIINLNKIKNYVKSDGGYLIMKNGDQVKVSRGKKDILLSLF